MKEKVAKKYEYNGITKIIKEAYELKKIEVKLATVEVDWMDFEDVELHIDGRIHFKKGDIEGRSKGYWRILDISTTDDKMLPEDLATCFAWANVEGQHLVVVISNSGEELTKYPDRYVYWIKRAASLGDCSINLVELKKSDVHHVSFKKASEIQKYRDQLTEILKEVDSVAEDEREKDSALSKRMYKGWEAHHSKELNDIVNSSILTTDEKNEQKDQLKAMFDQENMQLQIELDKYRFIKEEKQKEADEVEQKILKKDAENLISSDSEEDDDEESEDEKRGKKRMKLDKNDQEAGKNAVWISSEEEEEDDDEDDETEEEDDDDDDSEEEEDDSDDDDDISATSSEEEED